MNLNLIRIGLLVSLLIIIAKNSSAQWQKCQAAYPEWPFSIEKVAAVGNNKCSVWKSSYQRTEGEESGQIWMTPIEDSYQYQMYQFLGGKPTYVSTYLPSGNRLETMEYFYRENLLAAIEVLNYDSLQKSSLKYSLQYLYHSDKGELAQRTKLYGRPNSRVRVLDEFEFDKEYRLTRQKSTVVGSSPYMDSLLGLKANEKRLLSTSYEDTVEVTKIFQGVYILLDDRKTFLNADKQPQLTEARNAKGEKLWTIDYHYEGGQLAKKIYWIHRTSSVASVEVDKKGKGKGKNKARKGKVKEELAPIPLDFLEPAVYKVEYFRYNSNGLLEQHLIEEEEQQTVLEYSYFTE